jgi:hypothetical protein
MTNRTSRCFGTLLLACCALAFSAAQSWAQGVPIVVPNLQPQLTPQQTQNLMMMRMMQSRGRHSVRTGVPQDIQMAPGVGGPTTPDATTANDIKSKSHKSSAEKRADARKALKEKKRAAKEDAKAKKAKLAKHVKAADDPADAK